MQRYVIEKVNNTSLYSGLRDLWSGVFGDEPEFVDSFYETFGADLTFGCGGCPADPAGSTGLISGYVICDGNKVVSALTLYKCGDMYVPEGEGTAQAAGSPVYVSYAICTDPEYRGRGYAAALTEYVREYVTEELRGISIVSPAEPSLESFYSDLGYREGFRINEETCKTENACQEDLSDGDSDDGILIWGLGDDGVPGLIDDEGPDPFDPGISVVSVSPAMYNKYRESFLSDVVHVSLCSEMMEAVRNCSYEGDGLLVINGGDAIAAVSEVAGEETGTDPDDVQPKLLASELLVNPMLRRFSGEIEAEIAGRLAEYYGLDRLTYRTPGESVSQSMYAASDMTEMTGYFGFPLE